MTGHTSKIRTPGDFALALQQARTSRGISQMELAQTLGVPQSTISAMESGTSTIYLRRLLTIAREVGLEFTATWRDDDAPGG